MRKYIRGVFGGSALRLAAAAAIAATMSLVPASAATIAGEVNFGGSVTVSLTTIDFLPGAGGFITLTDPSTGYFAGLSNVPPDTSATIVDLGPGNPPPFSPFIHSFTGTGLPPALAGLVFNINSIVAPTGPSCLLGDPGLGNSCSFGVFNLLNVGPGSTTITLLITGEWVNGADSGFGKGRFSTQYGSSINGIVSTILGDPDNGIAPGSITTSYSAQIDSVPEPGTMALAGLALVAVGVIRRMRN